MEKEKEIEQKLKNASKVVGLKQVLRAIASDELKAVVLSDDADEPLKEKIVKSAQNAHIQIQMVSSKDWLGKMCDIAVCAAVVGLLK